MGTPYLRLEDRPSLTFEYMVEDCPFCDAGCSRCRWTSWRRICVVCGEVNSGHGLCQFHLGKWREGRDPFDYPVPTRMRSVTRVSQVEDLVECGHRGIGMELAAKRLGYKNGPSLERVLSRARRGDLVAALKGIPYVPLDKRLIGAG